MPSLLRATVKTLREVFAQPRSWLLAMAVAGTVLLATIALMNHPLLTFVFSSSRYNAGAKLKVAIASLGSFRTNLPVPNQIAAITSAIFAGVNISVIAYYLNKRIALRQAMGASALGVVGSLLGVGCASCGSVLLVSVLGLTSAGGLLSVLPLGGLEFAIASLVIFGSSFLFTAWKIQSPTVCKK